MAKTGSKLGAWIARCLKILMAVLIVPLAVGLWLGVLSQLDVLGPAVAQWVRRGFVAYVGIHVLLYRPATLFRASHRLFSMLAVGLFGGQVASTEGEAGGKKSSSKKDAKEGQASSGSTLVAFSPYAIPVSVVLACALGWLLGRWVERAILDGVVACLLGLTSAFHWLMTAEELQQQRSRWHLETYLVALGLVFVLTLLIGAACVPWALPGFSFVSALSEGLSRTQAIYLGCVQRLFL